MEATDCQYQAECGLRMKYDEHSIFFRSIEIRVCTRDVYISISIPVTHFLFSLVARRIFLSSSKFRICELAAIFLDVPCACHLVCERKRESEWESEKRVICTLRSLIMLLNKFSRRHFDVCAHSAHILNSSVCVCVLFFPLYNVYGTVITRSLFSTTVVVAILFSAKQ